MEKVMGMNDKSNDFASRMNGRFYGILQWADLDALWLKVRAEPQGWYAALTGEAPPTTPMTAEELGKFITEIDALLHKEHHYNYCGVVYVDEPATPTILKIFDPYNMGSGCRVGGEPIPPLWVLSRIQPTLMESNIPLSNSRRRWWQELFVLNA
jgi:hypothetical protein